MSPRQMYARVLAGDPAWNGRFFTGVLTTGIYCLPSCKARKPKLENIRFFPTCEAARAAGLRACKKCHPDDFARGADPVLEAVEAVVAEIRQTPAAFPDTRAVVRRLGFGTTRTFELFRLHYHTTPADVLVRARVAAAQAQLLPVWRGAAGAAPAQPGRQPAPASISGIAFAVGFDAVSAFHENFRRLTGLTPAAYRDLPNATEFEIALPAGYPLGYLKRALGRDAQSLTERLTGETYVAAVRLAGEPALVRLELEARAVRVHAQDVSPALAQGSASFSPVRTAHDLQLRRAVDAHRLVVGLLGLDEDAAGFARLVRKLGLGRLIEGRPELRISRTPSVFDGLVWAIIGQQINFAFACVLKRRLTERAGTRLDDGLYLPPTPEAIAALSVADLLPLQFSRQKAEYLLAAARTIAAGHLALDALPACSATRAERTLLALRGFGPWSVNYIMMRALGFPDCVPLGDTGVTSGLQKLLQLGERPDVDATRRLMSVFSPYRSLATAHLWQFDKPLPT